MRVNMENECQHRPARKWRGPGIALSAMILAGTGTASVAADAFSELAPCFTTQHSVEGLIAAFEADGWTLAETEADQTRVANAIEEINWALITSPGRFSTADQALTFLEAAHSSHSMRTDPFTLMLRGDQSLHVEYMTNGHRGQNICLLSAPELPFVRDKFPPSFAGPGDTRAFAAVDLRLLRAAPNIRKVEAVAARLNVPEAAKGMLAGGDGVQLFVTYKWE
ncbi:MAG: hypothetical protein K8F59_03505 [Rhodobacteraceae bacterium]|nr:hypothetical protein [Paracoccaceae bacterium]